MSNIAFCINSKGQYFVIEGAQILQSQFKRCSFYSSSEDLYEAIAQLESLDLEEVEGGEIQIKFYDEYGLWFDLSDGKTINENNGLDHHQLPAYVSNYQ